MGKVINDTERQDKVEEELSYDSEKFDKIVQDLKIKFFSKSNFPKLIVGTGLSIDYGLPGMVQLAQRLENDFAKRGDDRVKEIWECNKELIFEKGLEEGLKNINLNNYYEREFVDFIKKCTAEFILHEEIKNFDNIMNNNKGFKKMLNFLRKSVSINNPMLDIMTPNYDRIIELVCDSLRINVVNGFLGYNIRYFNYDVLNDPAKYYGKNFCIRLFKPHGSLDWIRVNDEVICTSDYKRLLNNIDFIEIVPPGEPKYQIGLVNNTFRYVREKFNEILGNNINYSLVIFGYGFNDEHFNTVLYNKFKDISVLIISKELKKEVIDKGKKSSNITLIYSENNETYLIYRCKKYKLDRELWNLNVFADIMFG